MKLLNLDFTRIAHDAFRIAGSKVLFTDPYKISKQDKADVVVISHEHFDHLSVEDLRKVITPQTVIVASSLCETGLAGMNVKKIHFLRPGEKTTEDSVAIEGVPAYNTNKGPAPGKLFHPNGEGRLGFIITMDGTPVYFAGDTDVIPEMKSVRCDIAMLPVSGTYVMTAEETAEAAKVINPKIAVPMHYGAIVGSEADAKKFKSLVKNCQVEII
jgi:L-ascorbate metabolism protein UlaG (beta-lactamase superfamily)